MKLELTLVAVVAVGLGAVGVTIAVGRSVEEPTVVSNPYEAGLHHGVTAPAVVASDPTRGCNLGAGPCTRPAGPYRVTLELGPRPLEPMRELSVAASVHEPGGAPARGRAVALYLQMKGMSMGENRADLKDAGDGRYTGRAVLVRCPSGRRDWIATVVVGGESAGVVARFELTAAE